jgi:hypothetical protein
MARVRQQNIPNVTIRSFGDADALLKMGFQIFGSPASRKCQTISLAHVWFGVVR